MFAQHSTKGFTLIELMITIAIIAVISAVGMTSYSQAQMISRDAKRKEDIRAIANALELYYQKNKSYPKYSVLLEGCGTNSSTQFCNSGSGKDPWISALTKDYISSVPKDPLRNDGDPLDSSTNLGYGFRVFANGGCGAGSKEGQYFITYARLENANDPDTLGKKDIYVCPGTPSLVGAGYPTNLFVVSGG